MAIIGGSHTSNGCEPTGVAGVSLLDCGNSNANNSRLAGSAISAQGNSAPDGYSTTGTPSFKVARTLSPGAGTSRGAGGS